MKKAKTRAKVRVFLMLAYLLNAWLNRAIVNSMEHEKAELEGMPQPEAVELEHEQALLTVGRIAEYLNKSYDWVQARVKKYPEHAQRLPDSQGRMRTYYPWEVIHILESELREIENYPIVSERDISISGISLVLERDEKWIAARLPFLQITGTTKRNPVNNRLFKYFDIEDDLPLLTAENFRMKSYPIATEDEATVDGAAKIMGVDRRWIIRRLRYIPLIPTVKYNPYNNRLGSFYVTEQLIEQLNGLSDHFKQLKPRHPSEVTEAPGIHTDSRVTTENWRDFASCAETSPDHFIDFQENEKKKIDKLKKICGSCAARLYCLDFAVTNDEREGMWGGLTYKERKSLKLV